MGNMAAELQNKLTISKQEIIEIVVADIQEKAHDEIERIEKLLDEQKKHVNDSKNLLEKKSAELFSSLSEEKLKPYKELGWHISYMNSQRVDSYIDARLTRNDDKMMLFLSFSQEEKDKINNALKDFDIAYKAHYEHEKELRKLLADARKDYEKFMIPGAMKSRAFKSLIAKSDGGEEILELISKIKKNFNLKALEDMMKK